MNANHNITIIKDMFHQVMEQQNVKAIPKFISPNIQIHKNNDVMNYDDVLNYVASLDKKYKKVTILPFDKTVVEGNLVTARYVETLHYHDGNIEKIMFISIFQIQNNKINRIWELAVPKK